MASGKDSGGTKKGPSGTQERSKCYKKIHSFQAPIKLNARLLLLEKKFPVQITQENLGTGSETL